MCCDSTAGESCSTDSNGTRSIFPISFVSSYEVIHVPSFEILAELLGLGTCTTGPVSCGGVVCNATTEECVSVQSGGNTVDVCLPLCASKL